MKIIAGLEPNDMRIINVSLPKNPPPKIALTFSGGLDSTLILYMIIKEKEERNLNTEIHCFTATQVGTKVHATNVLRLPEFAGKIIHHTDVYNPVSESVKPVTTRLLEEGWILYGGSNQVPLEQIGGRYPLRPTRNPTNLNNILPLLFLFKYHIVDAYYQLGIEHIMPITHSCTEWIEGECGVCYACCERDWAFEKLGRVLSKEG